MLPADMMMLSSIAALRTIADELEQANLPAPQARRLTAMLDLASRDLAELRERLRDDLAEERRFAHEGRSTALVIERQCELPSNVIPFRRRQ